MAGSSHARVRRRRAVFAAPAYLTTVFALELALSAGFGPTAWTTPYTGTMSTRRSSSSSSSVSDWRPRERRAVRHGGVHVAARAGLRERLRVMAAMGAAADGGGGGGGKRAEGRGSQMKGDESASASTNDEGSDNFYSLFGLSVGASADEIKDAYRQLAMKAHPDSEGANADRDRFELLAAAYEVLSDPGKRSTYDQGLAMKSFVDKVKAGNWGKTLLAVANLGAAATSVGVSVGVAAAQPLAKDLARGFEDLTVKGVQPPSSNEAGTDPLTREQQMVHKAKTEAERKLEVLKRKAEDALAEAEALEGTEEARLKEQGEWNVTFAESQQEVANTEQMLLDARSRVAEASAVLNERKTEEQEATEAFRQCKAARDVFSQASSSVQRKVSSAEATVAGAEQRLAEALKALDTARQGLESACEQATELEEQRSQVFGDTDAAGVALAKAKELSLTSRTALTKHQNSQAALQADLRTKSKQEGVAAAKVKELGDLAEAAYVRAIRVRSSAEESMAAAQREIDTIEAATHQESRLRAEAVAAKAAQDAAAAAAQQEKAQREREEAAAAAAEAVARARAAEEAAGAAAEAAIAAATAARQATADAVAMAEASKPRTAPSASKAGPRSEVRSQLEAGKMEAEIPPIGGVAAGSSGGVYETRDWSPVTMSFRNGERDGK